MIGKKLTIEEVDSELKIYSLKRIAEYKNSDYPIQCIDSEGYKVNARLGHLRMGKIPGRFSPGNPNSIENICLWIKLNNKPVTLIMGQTYSKNTSPLNLRCNKCLETYKTCWAYLRHGHGCPYCSGRIAKSDNNLAKVRPDLIKYFDDPRIARSIKPQSSKKIILRCPKCGNERSTRINVLYSSGFSCKFCSDGISIPEKFMAGVLRNFGVSFETQFRPAWSMNKRYDFYIESLNLIIEIHGEQHYKQSARGKSLKEEKKNDKIKKVLATKNNTKYLVVDCRKSTLEWLKNNITEALGSFFDLSVVDWSGIFSEAQNSLCVKTWDLWNLGHKSSLEISKKLKLDKTTVVIYLKRGAEIKKIDYNPKEQNKNITAKALSKCVDQYSLSGEFIRRWVSGREIHRKTGICYVGIYNCANNKQKHAGGFVWRYSDDNL